LPEPPHELAVEATHLHAGEGHAEFEVLAPHGLHDQVASGHHPPGVLVLGVEEGELSVEVLRGPHVHLPSQLVQELLVLLHQPLLVVRKVVRGGHEVLLLGGEQVAPHPPGGCLEQLFGEVAPLDQERRHADDVLGPSSHLGQLGCKFLFRAQDAHLAAADPHRGHRSPLLGAGPDPGVRDHRVLQVLFSLKDDRLDRLAHSNTSPSRSMGAWKNQRL